MVSPGNELIDGANSVEKRHILIAHHIEKLHPEQQADKDNSDQN
jgi:hypothetical protein